jgi:hypothetical protein
MMRLLGRTLTGGRGGSAGHSSQGGARDETRAVAVVINCSAAVWGYAAVEEDTNRRLGRGVRWPQQSR